MSRILLVDCTLEVTNAVDDLLGDICSLERHSSEEEIDPRDYTMIILESDKAMGMILQRIAEIRYACKFRNIPIILIKQREDHLPIDQFFATGATEVLTLEAPPAACRQILQGYLSPNRTPLVKEMEYLTPFIENTINVVKTMASMEATFREVWFSKEFKIFGDISGIIGLSGDSEGLVAVTFYWSLARKVIAEMLKVKDDQITMEYIHDGVGELINMISGSTKKVFSGTPYYFELSIPTVVVGSGHQLGSPEAASVAALIFDVGDHAFALQVCLKPKNKNV